MCRSDLLNPGGAAWVRILMPRSSRGTFQTWIADVSPWPIAPFLELIEMAAIEG
jgi:hypothetical protein